MNYPSCWLASFRSNDHAPPKLVCLNFSQPPHFLAELAGNITSIATLANGESDAQSFSYDSLNRLLAATATGASPYTESYSYDVIGNITAFNGAAYSYSGSQPHAVVTISGGQSFSYDDNGNMTARNDGTGSYTQAWDVENRLVQVTDNGSGGVTTFTYDAGGNRVKTVKPDGSITYTPFPNYEETVDGATTTTRATYSLGGQPIAIRVSGDPDPANNGLFTLHNNHLGSVSAMSDENGALVPGTLARYTPFGSYRSGGPNQITDRAYTGQRENMSLGLYYYNARYFAPGLGRFVSADTIVPSPKNPQSLNRYAYTLNSPINFLDPTGHWECAADVEQNRCTQWVEEILNRLRDGGDVSHGLYLWFVEYDQLGTSRNSTGVVFEIIDGGNYDAQISFCGGATGLCNFIQDPSIQIDRATLAGLPDEHMAALIGHEITHLYQGDLNAFSALGEMGAYYTQALLLEELGGTPRGAAQDAKSVINIGSFDILDAQQAKNNLVNNYGYSPLLPIWPLWDADPDFYSFIVEPAQTFRTTSINEVKAIVGGPIQ